MEPTKIDSEGELELGIKDQFAKVILAAAAGFVASKVAESLYDNLVKRRLTRNI